MKQAKQKKLKKTRKSKPHTHLDAYIETQAKFNIPISRCDKESALKNQFPKVYCLQKAPLHTGKPQNKYL